MYVVESEILAALTLQISSPRGTGLAKPLMNVDGKSKLLFPESILPTVNVPSEHVSFIEL